jgi:hypothetical protein
MQPLLLHGQRRWHLAVWTEATGATLGHVVSEALSTQLMRLVNSAAHEKGPLARCLGADDAVGFALEIITIQRLSLSDLPGPWSCGGPETHHRSRLGSRCTADGCCGGSGGVSGGGSGWRGGGDGGGGGGGGLFCSFLRRLGKVWG